MPSSVIISGGGGGGSSSGGNASVGVNGSPAPLSSTEIGFINASGNEVGVSASNPLPITGTITALNASVDPTGVAAPAFATEIGVISAGGNLVGASATNPVRIDPTGTTIQPVSGTITALQGTSPWVVSGTVTITPSGLQNINLTQLNSVALGSPSAYGTSPGAVNVIGVNAFVTNLPATQTIAGNKTNNNAAPGTTNLGALVAIANAAAPTYTEGDQVLLSTDLSGTLRNNIAKWGGTTVSAPPAASTPPAGTEVAPVIRPIGRKQTQILTTTPLAGAGVFTSSWFDTNATGDVFVSAFAFTNAAANSSTNGFIIQGTDDQSNASLTKTLALASVTGTALAQITAFISTQYWRVQYTNGATTQVGGAFEITATSINYANDLFIQSPPNPTTFSQAVWTTSMPPNVLNPTVIDGRVAFQQTDVSNTVAGIPASLNMVSTGTAAGFFQRTPAVFKTASVPATASGNTAVWTPAAGKKFRLMKFQISGTNLAATAVTTITISFVDGATGIAIGTYDVLLPAVATSTAILVGGSVRISEVYDLGNGYLSLAANNVLSANVSATVAGATGSFRYNVIGTEE